MKNIERLAAEFAKQVKEEGTYATEEQINQVMSETAMILLENPDKTPEEIMDIVLEDTKDKLLSVVRNYSVPGGTIGFSVGTTNIKLCTGLMEDYGEAMREDAMFDIASITKLYTQIIACNLMKDKAFNYRTKVKDLDLKYKSLENLTIGDIMSFTASFKTPGRIDQFKTTELAREALSQTVVTKKEQYNYNDIGMMILGTVMEKVTGKSYDELVEEYITKPLGLTDTKIIIPNDKKDRITGTSNIEQCFVNDPKAVIMGKTGAGHASIFASSDDLLKLGRATLATDIVPNENKAELYTAGVKPIRGIIGNTYVSHPKGIAASYVDILDPIASYAVQGSTRVQLNASEKASSTILFNPCSITMAHASFEERRINNIARIVHEQKVKEGKAEGEYKEVKYINHYESSVGSYNLIDARQMLPAAKMEPIISSNAKATLALRFVNEVVKSYEPAVAEKGITMTKHLTAK